MSEPVSGGAPLPPHERLALALVATKIRGRDEVWTRVADVLRLVNRNNRYRGAFLGAVLRRGVATGYLEELRTPGERRRRDRRRVRLTARGRGALETGQWGEDAAVPPGERTLDEAVRARLRLKCIARAEAGTVFVRLIDDRVVDRTECHTTIRVYINHHCGRRGEGNEYEQYMRMRAVDEVFYKYRRVLRELVDGTGRLHEGYATALFAIEAPDTLSAHL